MSVKARAPLTGATKVVAVWGHPVSHSRSPAMQNAALAALGLDWVYVPFDVDPANLKDAVNGLRAMGFVGANCTVPLKETVRTYLDFVSSESSHVGSVNTIINKGGELSGHTTDGPGLVWDLERKGIDCNRRSVLIWGAGGSARGVAYTLGQRGCRVTVANRTFSRALEVANLAGGRATDLEGAAYENACNSADILINTTTLGMGDAADDHPPLPAGGFRAEQVVYDLVYASSVTPLVAAAAASKCAAFNGLGMLVCQGALSLSLWTGIPASEMPLAAMDSAVQG